MNFPFKLCLVDLRAVVEGKIDWGKLNFGEFDRKFTLDRTFLNFVMEFP
jgi:hypothetical protein